MRDERPNGGYAHKYKLERGVDLFLEGWVDQTQGLLPDYKNKRTHFANLCRPYFCGGDGEVPVALQRFLYRITGDELYEL